MPLSQGNFVVLTIGFPPSSGSCLRLACVVASARWQAHERVFAYPGAASARCPVEGEGARHARLKLKLILKNVFIFLKAVVHFDDTFAAGVHSSMTSPRKRCSCSQNDFSGPVQLCQQSIDQGQCDCSLAPEGSDFEANELGLVARACACASMIL